jgi:hypothetical protein
MLENSSMMNISTFVTDGYQKEKLRQIELISDILKDQPKYENILSQRTTKLMPILNYWKQGNTKAAIDCIEAYFFHHSGKPTMSKSTFPRPSLPLLASKQALLPKWHFCWPICWEISLTRRSTRAMSTWHCET